MRVLYIASNGKSESTLRIEQDITELTKATAQSSGDAPHFIFLPALPFEDIEQQVAAFKPDIVHISAHGKRRQLRLSDSEEESVAITAPALRSLLAAHLPKVLYLNACTVTHVAKELASDIPFTIGTTADITNLAARKSAVTFYRCLLRGQSVATAYKAAATVASAIDKSVKLDLHRKQDADDRLILFRSPQLLARFVDDKFTSRSETFKFELGLAGASVNTRQIVVCTDDDSFPEEETVDFIQTNAINGEVWLDNYWTDIEGDFRLYALGATASGRCYSVAGTLIEAITNFYNVYFDVDAGGEFPQDLRNAIEILRQNDGSLLRARRKTQSTIRPSKR